MGIMDGGEGHSHGATVSARWLTIEGKHRQHTYMLASLKDFTYSEGDEVEAEVLLRSPVLSLYCLDDETQRAIFVELPPEIDLAKVPFIYMTQYEQAQRLLSVPYETLVRLAAELPDPPNLIAVYMTGRSGSTLLNHVFNELDSVMSLSEPDVITQFVHLRNITGRQGVTLQELLRSTLRFVCKPTAFKDPSIVAVKFRAEGIQVMDLVTHVFPQVHNLFLYRNAIDWVASFYRIFKRVGVPDYEPRGEAFEMWPKHCYGKDLPDPDLYLGQDDEVSVLRSSTLFWLATMEQYLKQHAKGVPVLAVRYEDLKAHREQVLAEIFAYCGLPKAGVQAGLRAFLRDSQEGTVLEQAKPGEEHLRLREDQIDEVKATVSLHPIISTPSFIVPGTLALEQGAQEDVAVL